MRILQITFFFLECFFQEMRSSLLSPGTFVADRLSMVYNEADQVYATSQVLDQVDVRYNLPFSSSSYLKVLIGLQWLNRNDEFL